MTNHQKSLTEERRLQSCKCGHGTIWHYKGIGVCEANVTFTPKRCPCTHFKLNWYITKEGKFNEFGERIR